MRIISAVILFNMLLLGCEGHGPSDMENESESVAAVEIRQPEASLERQGTWFPNTSGFDDFSYTSSPPTYDGKFVLTSKSVKFLIWDKGASKFVEGLSISRSEVTEASVASHGFSRRLVVVTDESVNTFALYGRNRDEIDSDAISAAAKTLNISRNNNNTN